VANSRGVARYPKVFTKRSICSFKMAVAETTGEQKLLRSTTMIFKPTSRLLLFALESAGVSEDDRYQTEVIIDNFVKAPVVVEIPSPKGKAAPTKGKKESPPAKTTPI